MSEPVYYRWRFVGENFWSYRPNKPAWMDDKDVECEALGVIAAAQCAPQPSGEPEACGPLVCKAAKDDGVICADDECDRVNGVRPAPPAVSSAAREALAERRVGSQ